MTNLATALWLEAAYQGNQANAPHSAWPMARHTWIEAGEYYNRHTNQTVSLTMAALAYAFRRAA